MNAPAPAAAITRVPGGFWHRYAAWSLDFVVISMIAWFATRARVHAGLDAALAGWQQLFGRASQAMSDALLSGRDLHSLSQALMQDPALRAAAGTVQDGIVQATLPFAFACAGIALLWHALGEASPWQGSPGKRAFGLIATDIDGNRLGFARAFARQLAGVASWLTLNLGHLLAMLPPQHRALHDYIAGTRVLRAGDVQRMPLPAKLWLWLQVLAGLAALAWAFARYLALLASIG
ncbi:RDD family protein [Pseudoluteimonas lycopersici]|uniref:RDD family protein n=1 Tax=Pseudoluteimonas lycopersici TaxID=1324796 RepID=UPI00163D84C8|nr:RDD family protein [Lysobacter lycopersici]